jgi:hypothetical protein
MRLGISSVRAPFQRDRTFTLIEAMVAAAATGGVLAAPSNPAGTQAANRLVYTAQISRTCMNPISGSL